MLPEKQSRRVFAQVSSAPLDDLRAVCTSSQTLTVCYQTLQGAVSQLQGHVSVLHSSTTQPQVPEREQRSGT